MSTNYFHRTAICECCGRYDEDHICKSLVSFQSVRKWDDETCEFVRVIGSWREWKARLLAGGQVWDEYGSLRNTRGFIAGVEATDPAARRRQYDMVRRFDSQHGEQCEDWLDDDGFSFTDGEFS